MRTHLITTILLFNISIVNAQNWHFVGPKSSTRIHDNFQAGQIDAIAVDPNPLFFDHIIVSSSSGIWETYDIFQPNGSWHILPKFDMPFPAGMGYNGVSAIAFRNHTELYAANYISISSRANYSNAVFKYDYNASPTPIWTKIGTLPFENDRDVQIQRIVFFPNDPDHAFLCTSKGLLESTNAGNANATWSWVESSPGNPIVANIYTILFIKKPSSNNDYYWYISGSVNPGWNSYSTLFMESTDDGATFNHITQFETTQINSNAGYFQSYSGICLGDQTASNGDRDIYISTAIDLSNPALNQGPWTVNKRLLHKFTRNITANQITVSNALQTTASETSNGPWRLMIGYDATNHNVLTAGVLPHVYDETNGWTLGFTNLHYDYHDIYINNSIIPNQIFVATDGGFNSLTFGTCSCLPCNNLCYNAPAVQDPRSYLNYGLDITALNGFSGATERNIYVHGQQDENYNGLYDEDAVPPRVIQSRTTDENDGGLIDKFDGNRLVICDNSSYNTYPFGYYISTNGPSSFTGGPGLHEWYYPNTSPAYYLQPASSPMTNQPNQTFGLHPFVQEPFREDRIFATTCGPDVFQLDPISNKFVLKVDLSDDRQHFTASSALTSCSTCSATTGPGSPFYVDALAQPVSISFSQLDNNVMYLVTNNQSDPAGVLRAAQVIKFIGSNLDDVWWNHNDIQDNNNTGNSQWKLITPDWQNSSLTWPLNKIQFIGFTGVETSNWDKNKIYVCCSYDLTSDNSVPVDFPYKIIVYNGAQWIDYSNGLPSAAHVTSMIMDHASNDGLYISTEFGVYYREPGMTSWIYYNQTSGTPLPVISSRQMEINYRENSVRTGTYGRGIWKSDLVCPSNPTFYVLDNPVSGYQEADDVYTNGPINTASTGATAFRATHSVNLEPGFTATATTNNFFVAFIHGCITDPNHPGTSDYNYHRPSFDIYQKQINKENPVSGFLLYPNPNEGSFTLQMLNDNDTEKSIYVLDMLGNTVWQQQSNSNIQTTIDISQHPKGIYFVKIAQGNKVSTQKIVLM